MQARSRPPKRRPRSASNLRLKQTKAAESEIEQYQLQREKRFKAREAGALGFHGRGITGVEKETQVMTILQIYLWQNRDEVLDNLLALVCYI